MITLEQTTFNVVTTKGLFGIPIEAFSFNWDILNRIWLSTFHKYERFCPLLKTIQTSGGNPIIMPEDCIYPRAIGFGNTLMIPPQTVAVDRQSWSYDRQTRQLSVFTNTSGSAPFQVQYLAKYPMIEASSKTITYDTVANETEIELQFEEVPEASSITITKGELSLSLASKTKEALLFDGSLGSASFNLTELLLSIQQTEEAASTAGTINISYMNKYKAIDYMEEDLDFFETWYAANLLTSLGNIKAILKMDQLPNDINADDLTGQGKELLRQVEEWQKEKQFWWRGYISARI